MLRASSLFVCLAALASLARAEVRALPPLTAEHLIGVWEAVPGADAVSGASVVYRMEIRKDAETYLVGMENDYCRFFCRLKSSMVLFGGVKLYFQTVPDAPATTTYGEREYVIDGMGWGDAESGMIRGKLIMKRSNNYPESTQEIIFKRSEWTRDLQQISREAEKIIADQRQRSKG